MRVIVIGLGSMGKRRIRLLKQVADVEEIVGIDFNEERRSQVESEFEIETVVTMDELINSKSYDIAFICTPPLTHYKIINCCLDKDLHIFTEINLISDGYDELITKASEKNKLLFLSSTMLYRKELQYVTKRVKESKSKLNYMYHVGQYLPDWHPWESYKDFFVNEVRTNGCRELFAIELPWIIEAFGKVEKLIVEKDKLTELDLNYADNYMVTIVHESGHKGLLHVNIVSRKAIRRLELIGEDIYLAWEGTPQTLVDYDYNKKQEITINTYEAVEKDKRYSSNIIENAYLEEIENFIDTLKGLDEPRYNFSKDKKILKLIDQIEGVGEGI